MYTNIKLQINFKQPSFLFFILSSYLLYHLMFSDLAVTKKFGCARTKTMQTLNGAMMPRLQKCLVNYMKTQPFSLTNDGTSDTGVKK